MRFLLLFFFIFLMGCISPEPIEPIEYEGPVNPLTGLYIDEEIQTIIASTIEDPLDAAGADLFFEIPSDSDPVYLAFWSDPPLAPAENISHPLSKMLSQGIAVNESGYYWNFYPPDYIAAIEDTASVIRVKNYRPFYYDPETCTYSRSDLPGLSWTNLFLLETDIYYDYRNNWNMYTDGGTGYYFSHGYYREIRWQAITDNSPFILWTEDGDDLYLQAGNSYFTFIQYDDFLG